MTIHHSSTDTLLNRQANLSTPSDVNYKKLAQVKNDFLKAINRDSNSPITHMNEKESKDYFFDDSYLDKMTSSKKFDKSKYSLSNSAKLETEKIVNKKEKCKTEDSNDQLDETKNPEKFSDDSSVNSQRDIDNSKARAVNAKSKNNDDKLDDHKHFSETKSTSLTSLSLSKTNWTDEKMNKINNQEPEEKAILRIIESAAKKTVQSVKDSDDKKFFGRSKSVDANLTNDFKNSMRSRSLETKTRKDEKVSLKQKLISKDDLMQVINPFFLFRQTSIGADITLLETGEMTISQLDDLELLSGSILISEDILMTAMLNSAKQKTSEKLNQ